MKDPPRYRYDQNAHRVRKLAIQLNKLITDTMPTPTATILLQVMRTVNAVRNTVIHNASLYTK